ncbi:MAG: energy-coupled thiamine transporter ThiT [Acholeplasmataceae bacterium]
MKDIQKLTFTSVLVATAVVFSLMTKFIPGLNLQMPQGGQVFGIAMLPIILTGILFGVRYGVVGGMLYGLTSLLLDGVVYHWASVFTDYVFAFGVLGLAGLFRKSIYDWKEFTLVFIFVAFLRYLSHAFGGAIIFAEFAPEGMNPWFYSFVVYNAPYMLSSTALTLMVGLLIRSKLILVMEDYRLIDPSLRSSHQ